MSEDLLKAIHQELVQIRQLLASGQSSQARNSTPARSSSSSSSYASSSSSRGSEEVPQPSEVIANAGDVQVHFGKNNGVALSKLGERSLSWYAQEQAPRLDSSGNPYPPRPQETTLRNAARTLWHQNKGTLGAAPAAKSSSSGDDFSESPSSSSSHPSDEEALPF
ncbi:hypothetical protein [Oleiharenicola lentus]|uniref:hypothetical protein n=1 Tax=Oleiharenicola lentus TaxID=2508720 RepID=UPI003F67C0CD